ncbi:MAG: flagellar hook-basal body complex protein FliE [Desulfomicrobium sp.]|jgi:flagellar hook-basal body complex protein FliE|nr:flagellar hook-basal body complex protein FliE [Desulfomicrobium sp.]NLV96810.1 flagellar hook-basal body complex protein FliE [Desulfovibrionales bacterium]
MATTPLAIKAYTAANDLLNASQSISGLKNTKEATTSFSQTLSDSLGKVNALQQDNMRMIEEFASGKSQNVHELMITLQKAGLAMDMTSAVRNKVMQAYQELMRIQF